MAPFKNPSDVEIEDLLRRTRTIAVLGLSPRPERASYVIASFLIEAGYEVYGVRPGSDEILGRPCYASLKDVPARIDLVDMFRRSEFVKGHVEECLASGVGALWLQLGVVDEASALKARATGIPVVMDRCILVEHRRLLRS